MKYFVILILILFSTNFCCANNFEEIHLQNYDIKHLKTPKTDYEKFYSINPEEDSDINLLESEEDIFDNKAGKIFSNFIDNKVINNKINKFSSKI